MITTVSSYGHQPNPNSSACINTYKGGLKKFMELAARQNKPLMLIICKPGCHDCSDVTTSIQKSGTDLNFINRFFLSCHVDLNQEKAVAASLLSRIGFNGEPSFVFLTPTGQFISKAAFIPHHDTLITLTASVLSQYKAYQNILLASSYGRDQEALSRLASEYARSVMSLETTSYVSMLQNLTQGDERLSTFEKTFINLVTPQVYGQPIPVHTSYGGPVNEEE